MDWENFKTWDKVLDGFDEYAVSRKTELDDQLMSKDAGLIKSYMLETRENGVDMKNISSSLAHVLRPTLWRLTPLNDDTFYRVTSSGSFIGFIEVTSSRYFVLHSIQKSVEIDRLIKTNVKRTSNLDFVWLAGTYFNALWDMWIKSVMQDKYVAFKFEHQSKFEKVSFENNGYYNTSNDDQILDEIDIQTDDISVELPSSTLSFNASVRKISSLLPELQSVWQDFKAIKMLRIPALEARGGYDFWDWGKITYRSTDFRNGRSYLTDVLKDYARSTELIEKRTWFETEINRISTGFDHILFKGTPVTFIFPEPLSDDTFTNFIKTTFLDNKGPFRLWGNPRFQTATSVHVYGVDMHLWQQIYLDMNPKRFIVILPKGTCGNTVHRLMSNIQRYVSPSVKAFIGDYPYEKLLEDVIKGIKTDV